jgi:heptosyltransferase-1
VRVLLVKTSSLGDVIHSLPALTDAARAIPAIRFDWLVEEAFAAVPGWHPAVAATITVPLRRLRRQPWSTWRSGAWGAMKSALAGQPYDAVIDAQGLLKSAWLSRYGRGPVFGPDRDSARESLAARFYDKPLAVQPGQHAVERVRQLLAAALGYPVPEARGDSGIGARFRRPGGDAVVFLHGTTWANKHWPEDYWGELGRHLRDRGLKVQLPWGNDAEKARARRIADACGGEVLPAMDLTEMAGRLGAARACVAVDTGLGHLAAAVGTPGIALFGPTSPGLTGFYGDRQRSLAADYHCAPCLSRTCLYATDSEPFPPCFGQLPPARVSAALDELLEATP